MSRRITSIKFVLAATLLLAGGAAGADTWDVTIVDPNDPVDTEGYAVATSLAFDLDGNPGIAYIVKLPLDPNDPSSPLRSAVKFAHWNGQSWDIELAVGPGWRGWNISLAYDPTTGNPAISHTDLDPYNLCFSERVGSSWSTTVLGVNAGWLPTSLGYDADGHPAICYSDYQRNELRLARRKPGKRGASWVFEKVDKATGWQRIPDKSLMFVSAGNPVIAYNVNLAGPTPGPHPIDLKLARWTGSRWNIQLVHPSTAGSFVSLALHPETGYPAIAHRAGEARIVYWNGSSWVSDAPGLGIGINNWLYPSLAYGHDGAAYVAYARHSPDCAVEVAQRGSSGEWTSEVVDIGGQPALRLAPDGTLSLSFRGADGFLRFARRVGP